MTNLEELIIFWKTILHISRPELTEYEKNKITETIAYLERLNQEWKEKDD